MIERKRKVKIIASANDLNIKSSLIEIESYERDLAYNSRQVTERYFPDSKRYFQKDISQIQTDTFINILF